MKIQQHVPHAQGSFGIPPQLKEMGDKMMKKDDEEKRPSFDGDMFSQQDVKEETAEASEESSSEEVTDVLPNPVKTLESLGVTLEDEDFQRIIFRGFIEKDVQVFPSIRGSKPLFATIKTLTVKEYDEIDELLAADVKGIQMTNEGFSTRRSLWILSYAVTKLMGKAVAETVFSGEGKTKEVDTRATAANRRKVITGLSSMVVNRLIELHGGITVAMEYILRNPEAEYIKKP